MRSSLPASGVSLVTSVALSRLFSFSIFSLFMFSTSSLPASLQAGITLLLVVPLYKSSSSVQNLFKFILQVAVIRRGSLGLAIFLGLLSTLLFVSSCIFLSRHILTHVRA